MKGQASICDTFWPLLDAVCDETLTETQSHELAAMLELDAAARSELIDHIQLQLDIRFLSQAERAFELGIARIRAARQTASACIASPTTTVPATAFHSAVAYFSEGMPLAYLLAAVITGLGLLVAGLVHVSQPEQVAGRPGTPVVEPQRNYVGKITGIVGCNWAEGSRVRLGQKYELASGLMEITYDTGAKVILQGPVTYTAEANGGYLAVGKLTGKLEKDSGFRVQGSEATNHESEIVNQKSSLSTLHSPLFTIRTPTATVTDLGTEFGVEVSKEGHTTSHVFRGSVELQVVAADGNPEGDVQVLHQNQSARVEKGSGKQGDGNRVTVFVTPAKTTSFVREISKQTVKILDLVDLVAHGNGFSHRRNRWIDPGSGRVTNMPPKESTKVTDYIVGDRKYHRVKGVPVVDGVFIPDGSKGPIQVDSTGHTFDQFPNTSNLTDTYVWAGGAVPAESSYPDMTFLDGVDYGMSGHRHLFLHANKGLTLDLDAIRRANPGCRLVRFCATAGNTGTLSGKVAVGLADAWVLVDAKLRFRVREINRYSGAIRINIPLGNNDRFLTLAATDSGDGIWGDRIIFGDPRLEMMPPPVSQETSKRPK